MKLVMFANNSNEPLRAGLLEGETITDLGVGDILDGLDLAKSGNFDRSQKYDLSAVYLGAPTPRPPSFRDFFAFEQHVANARRLRGAEVPPEWYEVAVFYFSNPAAFLGPQDALPYPAFTRALDLEHEVAIVIGKDGRNISAADAHEYIAGFMILNDWSGRTGPRQSERFCDQRGSLARDAGRTHRPSATGRTLRPRDGLEAEWKRDVPQQFQDPALYFRAMYRTGEPERVATARRCYRVGDSRQWLPFGTGRPRTLPASRRYRHAGSRAPRRPRNPYRGF
jgi:hypothetical protein